MAFSQTAAIIVETNPSRDRLVELGVFSWPIWTKEISTFSWIYETSETCYFLKGDVVVTPVDGDAVRIGKGDLVTFPAGMSCTWQVFDPVEKHYAFD